MSTLKLKPCPFCGGEAVTENHHNRYTDWWEVKCTDCSTAMNERYEYEFEAVEAWNTRKPMDSILEKIEEVRNAPDVKSPYNNGWETSADVIKHIIETAQNGEKEEATP